MKFEKDIGPINFTYDSSLIERKQRYMTIASGFVMYVVALYGVLGFSIQNMFIAMVAGAIVTAASKRYCQYKNAAQYRKTLTSEYY